MSSKLYIEFTFLPLLTQILAARAKHCVTTAALKTSFQWTSGTLSATNLRCTMREHRCLLPMGLSNTTTWERHTARGRKQKAQGNRDSTEHRQHCMCSTHPWSLRGGCRARRGAQTCREAQEKLSKAGTQHSPAAQGWAQPCKALHNLPAACLAPSPPAKLLPAGEHVAHLHTRRLFCWESESASKSFPAVKTQLLHL